MRQFCPTRSPGLLLYSLVVEASGTAITLASKPSKVAGMLVETKGVGIQTNGSSANFQGKGNGVRIASSGNV